jgi:hypothetical protein
MPPVVLAGERQRPGSAFGTGVPDPAPSNAQFLGAFLVGLCQLPDRRAELVAVEAEDLLVGHQERLLPVGYCQACHQAVPLVQPPVFFMADLPEEVAVAAADVYYQAPRACR